MASISGDESVAEEIGPRRTRSGRKVNVPITPTRNTRRSSQKRISEGGNESEELKQLTTTDNMDIAGEQVSYVQETIIMTQDISDEAYEEQKHVIGSDLQEDKSSSFPFEQPDLNALYDQSSTGAGLEADVQPTSTDSIDNLLATLAEDNANSLPPVSDESSTRSNDNMNVSGDTNEAVVNSPHAENVHDVNSESSSCLAIAEAIQNGSSEETKVDGLDAEMVSEDELPAPNQPKVDDAEEVSDEELPGPRLAELPADTEVVSEDELPASNKIKRKADESYDPSSPTDSAPEKRPKPDADNPDDSKQRKSEYVTEKKSLPDLDKYWKAVNDDPTDFTAWTYLLQYVDQENDIDAAREAYDAFLAHYPYCYGYWRKYADYGKRKGNKKKCEEVFERGLKAIPLSVDLWIHYLSHVKTNYAEEEEYVRSQFERAISACGLEFRSDKLWEAYIKWEYDNKRIQKVVNIYDRLLATPTQGYSGHFDSFQEIVNNNAVESLVTVEEFRKLRAEVRESEKISVDVDSSLAPGEEEPDDHVRNENEALLIKDRVLAARRKIQKSTVTAVSARWTFEEGIKRPYFHVKPLERCQLKNWKGYLDFEIEQGDQQRVIVLFERCLIACAMYDEFWLKFIRYLESKIPDTEIVQKTREVYERACTIHHPDKPSMHLMWAAFEELHENPSKAADILSNLEKVCPNLIQVAYRRINLERRRGDMIKCTQLYEHYIANSKNKNTAGSFAIKYARFCHKIKGELDVGLNVLRAASEKDPSNTRVVLQLIDMALQRERINETEVIKIMDDFLARENLDPDQKVLFTQRKVEFLEDFGTSAKDLQDAQKLLQAALSKANENKSNSSESPHKKTSKETSVVGNNSTAAAANATPYNASYYNSGNSSTYYGNNQYSTQAYGDTYGYNQWQQYGSNYGSYGQWSGYY